MNEKKPFSLLIIMFTLAMFCSYHIYYYTQNKVNDNLTRNYEEKKENNDVVKVVNKEDYLGILEIPKINLVKGFYTINSSKNNVNSNVTLLKDSIMPNKEKSIIYLAAHSGTGYVAYFKDLDKLNIDDKVIINYQNKKYIYNINDIYEIDKNGTITVNHNINEKYIVLTTCSKNKDKQLVITGKLIK